jgi:hypothetical protein
MLPSAVEPLLNKEKKQNNNKVQQHQQQQQQQKQQKISKSCFKQSLKNGEGTKSGAPFKTLNGAMRIGSPFESFVGSSLSLLMFHLQSFLLWRERFQISSLESSVRQTLSVSFFCFRKKQFVIKVLNAVFY